MKRRALRVALCLALLGVGLVLADVTHAMDSVQGCAGGADSGCARLHVGPSLVAAILAVGVLLLGASMLVRTLWRAG